MKIDLKLSRPLQVVLLFAAAAVALGGCGGTVNVGSLPIDQAFDDCGGFTMNDEIAKIECPDGRLRVLVSKPDVSPVHLVPFRFEPAVPGLTVSTELRAQHGEGEFGIGCDASGPGEPGRGYLFLLQPSLRAASIFRMEGGPVDEQGRFELGFDWIAIRQVPGDLAGGHQLRATCFQSPGGVTYLRLEVDGRRVLEADDRDGIGSFRSAVTAVQAYVAGTDVRFDGLRAERTGLQGRSVTRGENPLRYRYAIALMDCCGTPVTNVSLGDDLNVIVSSPDLPRDQEVRFQLCVVQAKGPVCTREHFDGGSSYLTGWTVDPGEGVKGRFRLSVRVKGREVAATSVAFHG
jgi:hypothetical protein